LIQSVYIYVTRSEKTDHFQFYLKMR